ncbi:MAG: peptidoglycan DD-metalloendopeptidase family protein [Patescibacteria group bacterium]
MKKNILNLKLILITFFILIIFGFFYFSETKALYNNKDSEVVVEEVNKEPEDRLELIKIDDGSTYGALMETANVPISTANDIYDAAMEQYDLAKIRSGKNIELYYDSKTDELKKMAYKIDTEEEIIIRNLKYLESTATTTPGWSAQISLIDYEVSIVTKEGEIKTSMYEAALENNIDERAIIDLANAFQWTIDFALDPRVGDEFKFVYEERYLDGEYIMPGKIMAGVYKNEKEKFEIYYFEETAENMGYFDASGISVQKMFLKAPVAFKYISSGFTLGARYIEAFNISTGHRAIDYAAEYGTPVRSVGDGSVIMASYNGAYGNMVKIHHNGTYTTNYGHLSKFAVKKGAKVKQGEVIGYVGSTGLSTGPHLHYEMVKDGAKVNPSNEVLPPGKPIMEENKDRFFLEIKKWQEMLFNN